MFFLYDPRTNILTETNYSFLEELTGKARCHLSTYKTRGNKLKNINCYLTDEKVTLKQRRAWYEKEKYENEVWKPIIGSDERFFVSNYGRFKKLYKSGNLKLLLPFLHKQSGVLKIKVTYQGKYGGHIISQLVGRHFIGLPKPGEVLQHKNGIKTDNFVGNLGYIQRNILAKKTGGLAKSKPVVQLDMKTLEVLNEYRSAREAGRKCFISYQAVMDNCNHKTKICCGNFLFMWLDEYENTIEKSVI